MFCSNLSIIITAVQNCTEGETDPILSAAKSFQHFWGEKKQLFDFHMQFY